MQLKTFFWATLTSAVLASGLFLFFVSALTVFQNLAPIKIFALRPTLTHRSTLQEIIKLAQASPRLALLWIGVAALLAAAFLKWLFVALLTIK
jgi:hypothetical protein